MTALAVAIVISVSVICASMVTIKLNAKKHHHKWWTEGVKVIDTYTSAKAELPTYRTSYFSQSCEGCGNKRIVSENGPWTSDIK